MNLRIKNAFRNSEMWKSDCYLSQSFVSFSVSLPQFFKKKFSRSVILLTADTRSLIKPHRWILVIWTVLWYITMATGVLALHEYTRSIDIGLLSFNMHGFHQGLPVLEDLINTENPVIILLQEHWLTPDNLTKFQQIFVDYFPYGSSAMLGCLQSGMLRGRPFGGVMTLVRKDMRGFTQTIHCDDCFVIIRFANYLIANVYLPCCGTKDRESLCSSILDDVNSWREPYLDCKFILAGDLNVNLDICDTVSAHINKFAHSCCLHRCDVLFPGKKASTYVNVALGHENCIDYILTSCPEGIVDFDVLDPDVNFSDHLPLSVKNPQHLSRKQTP